MADNGGYTVHLSCMEMDAATPPVGSRNEAEQIARGCSGRMCQVVKDIVETATLDPPRLFHLPALQAEAGRLFGYPASLTEELAFSLYGKGLLTDPKTGSRSLPVELGYPVERLIRIVSEELPFLAGYPQKPDVRRLFGGSGETGHAILPVPVPGYWAGLPLPRQERNILFLVAARVAMAAADAHIHENHRSRLTCNFHTFFIRCRYTRQEGYLGIESRMKDFFGIRQEGTCPREMKIYLGRVFGPCDTYIEQWKARKEEGAEWTEENGESLQPA